MKWHELDQAVCPVARALSVVGDRWTLLILRDCFLGRTRFDAFIESLGLTRHVLSDRLARLVSAGVLEKRLYGTRPPRYDYVLTERGRALGPVLLALKDWGKAHRPLRRPSGPGADR